MMRPVVMTAALLGLAGTAAHAEDVVMAMTLPEAGEYVTSMQLKLFECSGTAKLVAAEGEAMAEITTDVVYQMTNDQWDMKGSTLTILPFEDGLRTVQTRLTGFGTFEDGKPGFYLKDGVVAKSDELPSGMTMWTGRIKLTFQTTDDNPILDGIIEDDKGFGYRVTCRLKPDE
ncbi:hypothetical protein [Asticcacaulis sp. AC460]|uniref:hypothetical protein n=1 Tax=Asticcacaulis sp. AC460 TaxID=1282360 RepID=UPI0012DE1053|nr:hypothetical protein [Asticcacaulis sp. AC460]